MHPSVRILRSIFSPESIAQLLEHAYNLTNVSCQFIKGTIRDVYLVRSIQGAFILSIYPHDYRDEDEILSEVTFLSYLSSQQLRVPDPIPLGNGELLLRIEAPEGLRLAVLFTYIEGRQLSRSVDLEMARLTGNTLGHFHNTADQMPAQLQRPQINFNLLVEQALNSFQEVVRHRQADIVYLYKVADRLRAEMENMPTTMPEYGLIHGDVIPSNIVITPAGQLALVDFDFCSYGWRIYDIATFLAEIDYWGMGDIARANFLEGYQDIRELSDEELLAIPMFEAARNIFSLGIPAKNVNTWGSAYQNDQMIDIHIQNIDKNMKKIKVPKDQLNLDEG